MTGEVYQFVESLRLQGRALDVGSYDVNGSVRELFDEYVGLDMREGPNVTVHGNSHHLPFPDADFDVVLSLETLEHDDRFWESVAELRRVLKPGGSLVITVPNYRCPTHNYPADYWRFSMDGVKTFYDGMASPTIHEQGQAIMAHGIKP